MKVLPHTAIHLSNKANKEAVIQQIIKGGLLDETIDLSKLKGEVFSTITLNHFIDEELQHEHFELIEGSQRNINTFSDGEQKKALLAYIISRKPEYIVVDNIFDSLDKASQASLYDKLKTISNSTLIIQLANRKNDILSFIKTVFVLDNNKISAQYTLQDYLQQSVSADIVYFTNAIPPPLHQYKAEKNPLIQFNNVSVSYDERKILNNINWQINGGEFWQLLGPNGAGKSTILSMITGDNPKAYGQDIILFGHQKGTGETVWELKEKIGYFSSAIAQQFSRLHSVEQMVISGFFDSIGLYTKPSDRQIELAAQWLSLTGLYKQRQKPFINLSLGHQRLVMIIRAMVKHPPLLILDEPTAGLDDEDAAIFIALVNKISQESNTAILYVSHRTEEGLSPQFIYELIAEKEGSTGRVN